jgi:hypothetical protein
LGDARCALGCDCSSLARAALLRAVVERAAGDEARDRIIRARGRLDTLVDSEVVLFALKLDVRLERVGW